MVAQLFDKIKDKMWILPTIFFVLILLTVNVALACPAANEACFTGLALLS